MDSLGLVVFVIVQDLAIGLQRLLQARWDDQRFPGSAYIDGWLLARYPRFLEAELVEKFGVSRSPVREALLALEKEGTLIISPYKGAIVRPLSAAEVLDIAELRLALISLALKPAYRHLSPADLDHAYDLAKRLTRVNNAKDFFEYN